MFVKYFDEGDAGGKPQTAPSTFAPATVIDQPIGTDTVNPADELYPDDFDSKGEQITDDKPTGDETPPEDETGEETPPEETPPEEGQEFYADETEFLKEFGLDEKYDNVRDAFLGLTKEVQDMKSGYEPKSRAYDKLEGLAQKLGMSPDDVLAGIETLDPRNVAAEGPRWDAMDKFLQQNVQEDHHQFYRNFGSLLLETITPAIEARFGRLLNSYDGQIGRLQFERQVDRFTANEKNAEWRGREEEIWDVLQNDIPHMRGKPNAIDRATRYIKSGEQPKTVKEQVKEETRRKLQELEAKRRKGRLEPPGRGPEKKPKTEDPTSQDYGFDRRGDLIDQLEAKGAMVGRRR